MGQELKKVHLKTRYQAQQPKILQSLLFAVVHLSLLNLVPLFVLALFLAWQYEKTGNLLCPIMTHAGFNLCNILIATGVIPLQKLFPES